MNDIQSAARLQPVKTTLAEQAYREIKRDIVSGELAPGLALRLELLKQKYQLSFSPLREALNRLQSERLVESAALKGFRVTPLSLEEMRDSMDARILIDGQALRRAIDNASDDWEANIVACLHALDRVTARQNQSDSFEAHYDLVEQRHLALHRALIETCGSRWLLDFSMQLYLQTERYRRPMLVSQSKSAMPRDVSHEHHEIAAATLNRDKEKAVTLLTEHYNATARRIEKALG